MKKSAKKPFQTDSISHKIIVKTINF